MVEQIADEAERPKSHKPETMQELRERELKFDVPADWPLPDLAPLVPVGGVVEMQHVTLKSTYFDTAERDLLASGVSLRQRAGDTDTGWQLKIPAGNARSEVRLPLGRGRTVPRQLQQLVLGVRAGAALAPVAVLHTERAVRRIVTASGSVLAEVADDQVTATILGGSLEISQWREVEVELVDADEQFLKQAARLLKKSGASPSVAASKIGRALAGTEPEPEHRSTKTLHGLIRVYLEAQRAAIISGDLELRRDRDVVHPTRVGTRRFRSILRIFAAEFDESRAAALDVELAWYAELLGQVRDRQVLRVHLDGLLEAFAPEVVLGPVATRVDQTLHRQEREARAALSRAMAGKRYLALITELRGWHEASPFVRPDRPAGDVAEFVHAAKRKVNKRLKHAARADHQNEGMHRARKAGKRARYAAELAEPALGTSARALVKRAKKLQDELGGLQDSVFASEFLRQLGVQAGTIPGENGFTFGVLWAHEQQRGHDVTLAARKALG